MKKIILILIILFLTHCSTQKLYRPLDKNTFEVHSNLGGPLFRLNNIPLFMPFFYIGANYGLTDKFSIGSDLPVSLFVFKNLAIDVHSTYFFTDKMAVKAELLSVWNIQQRVFQLYPMLTSWYVFYTSKTFYIMPGLNAMFQTSTPVVLSSPFVNVVKTFGKWNVNFEFEYLVPYLNKQNYNLDYLSFGYGGFGINFGIGRQL